MKPDMGWVQMAEDGTSPTRRAHAHRAFALALWVSVLLTVLSFWLADDVVVDDLLSTLLAMAFFLGLFATVVISVVWIAVKIVASFWRSRE
jgi:hypothetical protein